MKTAQLPPVRVEPAVREEIESVLLEDIEVLLGIVGGRQQRAKDDGADQDQRLAALPERSKGRQGLETITVWNKRQ